MGRRKLDKKTQVTIGTTLYENDFDFVMLEVKKTFQTRSHIVAMLVREAVTERRRKATLIDTSIAERVFGGMVNDGLEISRTAKRYEQKFTEITSLLKEVKEISEHSNLQINKSNVVIENIYAEVENTKTEVVKNVALSNSTLQNVIILRWLFLIFHYMFYSKLHPMLEKLNSKVWADFAQASYNRAFRLKTIELANIPQKELEIHIAKQSNELYEEFKKLNANA